MMPADEVMGTLELLARGTEFGTYQDGSMAVRVPTDRSLSGYAWAEVGGDELDVLLRLGWVRCAGDDIGVTEAGRYWLGVWRTGRARRLRQLKRGCAHGIGGGVRGGGS